MGTSGLAVVASEQVTNAFTGSSEPLLRQRVGIRDQAGEGDGARLAGSVLRTAAGICPGSLLLRRAGCRSSQVEKVTPRAGFRQSRSGRASALAGS